ncbi:hypothetical protein CSB45_00850 [candidate division KSB3 bacterium]|uniref:Uncharacterized protein n=1 Tax=candidate division KSB3 bacterium TaxID=2044937 RepID=A0A2G6EBY4_9BACT|nr:MAG: hypothetical protein CSB45_00850 [candidate division KSB3 bacterium]PIE28319.1 MAG: hypothetical protein CSA57_14495 [candidate division KSB3 bacterium]
MKKLCLMLCCALILWSLPASAERYALLVGIDAYSWPITALDGCLKDVEMMRNLLTKYFDFPAEDVKTVLNEEATFASIEAAFRSHLIEQAQPGDAVVFYYSGHGTRTPDGNGDEADQFDESLCPVDSSPYNESSWLTDDILNDWLSKLRTKQVTVILDSCFSGTATRAGREYRSKFADFGFHAPKDNLIKSNYHDSDMAHVLLAASSPEESSLQISGTGSLFTMVLADVLLKASADVTYQFVIDAVAPAVSQLIAEHFPDSPQTPQAEGDLAQPVFAEDPAASASLPPAEAGETAEGLAESVQYADFPLHISTNKTAFEENDVMVVSVEAGRDCYLALYIIDAEQHVTQIFPNKWQQENFIKAGESVQIPPDGADFRFRMTGPFGTETLKADASTKQFPDLEHLEWDQKEAFMEFGCLPLPKLNMRGVSVEQNQQVERSQAVLRYRVRQQ